jgi:hypothetical protein
MIKPAEAFKNWVGGFTDFNVTIGFAANGSIPVTSAGKISLVIIDVSIRAFYQKILKPIESFEFFRWGITKVTQ